MTLLTRIKMLCVQNNTTISKLEKTLYFGNGTISRWDVATPSGDRLAKVADHFHVSVDYLLGREINNAEDSAKNETEKRLLILCRKAGDVPAEEREAIVKNFESTIDMYLKAKGIKEE